MERATFAGGHRWKCGAEFDPEFRMWIPSVSFRRRERGASGVVTLFGKVASDSHESALNDAELWALQLFAAHEIGR